MQFCLKLVVGKERQKQLQGFLRKVRNDTKVQVGDKVIEVYSLSSIKKKIKETDASVHELFHDCSLQRVGAAVYLA